MQQNARRKLFSGSVDFPNKRAFSAGGELRLKCRRRSFMEHMRQFVEKWMPVDRAMVYSNVWTKRTTQTKL